MRWGEVLYGWAGPLPSVSITVPSLPRFPYTPAILLFTPCSGTDLFFLLPTPPICMLNLPSSFNTQLEDLLFCKISSNLPKPHWSFFSYGASLTSTYFCDFTSQVIQQSFISLIPYFELLNDINSCVISCRVLEMQR